MDRKKFIFEITVTFLIVMLLFMSLAISLDSTEIANDEKDDTQIETVGYAAAKPLPALTGSERNDIVAIAMSQEHYLDNRSDSVAYTVYNKWYSDNIASGMNKVNWCAIFVTWSGRMAGCDNTSLWYPHSKCSTGYDEYKSRGRAYKISSGHNPLTTGYTPVKGDLLYSYATPSHVSIWTGSGDINGDFSVSGTGGHKGVEYVSSSQRANSSSYGSLYGWGRPYYRSKVTYYKNGGTISNEGNYTKYTEEKGMTLPTPTKSGSKFGGWYDNSGFTGSPITSISSSEKGIRTYYAKWASARRNIYYYRNGGDWNGAAGASSFDVDAGYTIPTNIIKGNGSSFIGWYNSNYTTKWTSIPAGHDADVYLYARYTAPITYVTNGGSWKSTPITKYTEGVACALSTNISRSGCSFQGWYYDASFTNKVPDNTIPSTKSGTITVYAKWSATLTFHTMVGSWNDSKNVYGVDNDITKTMTYYPGTSKSSPGISNGQSLYTASDLYQPWSTFQGWYTSSSIGAAHGPLYKIGDTLPTGAWPWTTSLNLYARWVGKDYKVYLHGNRGTTKNGSWTQSSAYEYYKDYTYKFRNNQITLPPAGTMERRGHTFEGWYNNSSFSGSVYTKTDKDSGGDKHFWAKWKPITYPVTLYTVRGKVTDTSYSFTNLGNYYYRYSGYYVYSDDYDRPLPTQPATIDRRGHDFKGWYTNDKFTGTMYTAIPKTTIGAQVYYAKWVPKIYQLKLNKEGATVTNTRIDGGKVVGDAILGTYTYAKGSTFPEATQDMRKDGAIFAGWYDNANHTGEHHLGIRSGDDDTAPIGDKEFWARWVRVELDPMASDSTELVNGELVTYMYMASKIKVSGSSVTRTLTDAAVNKRFFGVKISVDGEATTKRKIEVFLSTSTNPNDKESRLEWKIDTTSSYNKYDSNTRSYTINDDGSKITFACPSDITSNFLKDIGSRKVYMHVVTETGDTSYYTINIVKRVIYEQH